MQRLLAQIGLTYLSVLIVVFYFGGISAVVISAIALICLVVILLVKQFRKKVYLSLIFVTAIIACFVNVLYTTNVYNKTVDKYNGKTISVCATLVQESYNSGGSEVYLFDVTKANGRDDSFSFVLYTYNELDIDTFDTIEMSVELTKTSSNQLKSKGYFLTASEYSDKPVYQVTSPDKKPFMYHILQLKEYIRDAFDKVLYYDAASLYKAIFIGDKYALDQKVRNDFVSSGVSHLIVVSGMHFSILFSFLLLLCDHIRRRFSSHRYLRYIKNIFYYILIALAVLYMLLCGLTPSVFRSGIMYIIYAIGHRFNRDAYPLNSLGFAALLITVSGGPYVAGDASLIMSFASVISIITIFPALYNKLRINKIKPNNKNAVSKILSAIGEFGIKVINALIAGICTSISALVVSVGVSILLFDGFSVTSVFVSVFLYPAIFVAMLLALIIAVFYYIPILTYITVPAGYISELLANFILRVVSTVADFHWSYIHVNSGYVKIWIVVTAVLLLMVFLIKSHRGLLVRCVCFVSAIAFCVCFLINNLANYNVTKIKVYNASNGIAVVSKRNDVADIITLDCNASACSSVLSDLSDGFTQVGFMSSVQNTLNSYRCFISTKEEFAINTLLLYDTTRTVNTDSIKNVIQPADVTTVTLQSGVVATFTKVKNKYVTTLDAAEAKIIILPKNIKISDMPDNLLAADYIITSYCPTDFDRLSCDTLIISAKQNKAAEIYDTCRSVCNKVLFTSDSEIIIDTEV